MPVRLQPVGPFETAAYEAAVNEMTQAPGLQEAVSSLGFRGRRGPGLCAFPKETRLIPYLQTRYDSHGDLAVVAIDVKPVNALHHRQRDVN